MLFDAIAIATVTKREVKNLSNAWLEEWFIFFVTP